jgi:hypothetical protein
MSTPTEESPSPTSEPASPLSAPAARSSVSPTIDSDGVLTLSTLPGSAPLSLILGGFLALLVSAWAAIVPFVGPSFGFSPDGTASWTWNRAHLLGALVPGAISLLACLIIVVLARHPSGRLVPSRLVSAGFLIFLCGAWFASVPVVWPVLVGSYFRHASPSLTLGYWMGSATGPGVLIAAFGAFAMGRAGRETHENS